MASELRGPGIAGTVTPQEQGKGFVLHLIVLYLFLDFLRPPFVWHFPKIIGIIVAIAWLAKARKVISAQIVCFVLFVGILAVDILYAANSYDAVWTTYGMLVVLIGICIPLISFTDSLTKLRYIVNALLGIFLYIAAYAIFHAGFGPAGTAGGQDENYVAAAMNLAIPLAWFSFLAERTRWKQACFLGMLCICVLAIVVGLSRGGLVGFLCALAYSLMKSPRKGLAITAAVAIGAILMFGSAATGLVKCNKYGVGTRATGEDCPSYWEHMSTMTQTGEGTADLRLELWTIATQEFLAYPLTGVGGGNYKWRMSEFQSAEQMEKYDRYLAAEVHSTYFQLLAETGLAGCLVFGFILLRTYRDYRHIERLSESGIARAVKRGEAASSEDFKWIRNYGRGLMGGLIGYMASAAFLSALYYSHVWVVVSLVVALYMIAKRRSDEDGKSMVVTEAKK